MKVVVAPDKFKGSMRATDVAKAIAAGIADVDPTAQIVRKPVADGGDGTITSLVAAGFTRIESGWARHNEVDVVELAATCGIMRSRFRGRHAAQQASSQALGALIGRAVDSGATTLVVGLGGSASTDGGAGMVKALGARLTDARGRMIPPGLAGLHNLTNLDLGQAPKRLAGVDIIVAADVDNPLLGSTGAAAVFGPQKGLRNRDWHEVDPVLARFADLLDAATGTARRAAPGAGAAGGVGYALMALGATRVSGVDFVLDAIGFARALEGADLVITGEGMLDASTLRGKAISGVARLARERDIPVVALCGRARIRREQLDALGVKEVLTVLQRQPNVDLSYRQAPQLLRAMARDVMARYSG